MRKQTPHNTQRAATRHPGGLLARALGLEFRSEQKNLGDLRNGALRLVLGEETGSGEAVNEHSATTVAAVTACVSLLADMVAKLPIELFQKTARGPVEVTDHPVAALLATSPSDLHTSFEMRQLMETGKGLGGNGYARVYRDNTYTPRAIEWQAPARVTPSLVRRKSGSFVRYDIEGESGSFSRADIIHVRGFSKNGYSGMAPVTMLRESIGTSMSQTKAAGRLMKNGTAFPGYLVSTQILPEDKINDARKQWEEKYTGANNMGTMPILNGHFDFKATSGMSMTDAQFLESRRFELQEIARLYRIPSFLVGDSTASTTWGSGIEQQTLGLLNFTLDPHLVAWEQSLAYTLLTTEEVRQGYYFRFDRDELANVALEARANFLRTMRDIGVFSPNDCRKKINEPTISADVGGDDYGKPFNSSGGTPQPQNEPSTVED